MGIYIKSTDTNYNAYMNAVRDRVGASESLLPNSKIDSYSYLQCVEDEFTAVVGPDFWNNSSEVTKKKIRQYLILRTIEMAIPDYPQTVRESEFSESVQYAEYSLEERLSIIRNKIEELGEEIHPDLKTGSGLMAAFEVFQIGE